MNCFPSSLEWGHHPHQRKDSWSSVMRLIRYISQRQQSQGQKKPSNNTIFCYHLSGRYFIDRHKKLNLTVNREPIKSSLDRETVTAKREIDENPKRKSKMVSNLTFCFATQRFN